LPAHLRPDDNEPLQFIFDRQKDKLSNEEV